MPKTMETVLEELRAGLEESLRVGMGSLRGEMERMRLSQESMQTDVRELKHEVRDVKLDVRELKSEMHEGFDAIREVVTSGGENRERLKNLEKRVGALEAARGAP